MNCFIGFNQHKVRCIIGVLAHERHHEQEIFVDLKVKTDFKQCAKTDSLHDTIDYMELAQLCNAVAKKKGYHLLETYAWEVLNQIFEHFPIKWAWIRVQKPAAMASGVAFVELEKE